RALSLIGGERTQKACRLDRELDAMAEILDRPLRDLRRVLLEAVGRVEQDRAGRRIAQPRDDLAMGRDHGGRGLARPHDREDARQTGAHAKNPSRTEPTSSSPTRAGSWRCRSGCPGENQMERSGPPAASAAASARRLAPVRAGSPESASIRSAGVFKVAQRVEGRYSQSDRRIE